MGREIRRVPCEWEHPKNEKGNYQPMFDEDFDTVLDKWVNGYKLWKEGKHEDQIKYPNKTTTYWDWVGNPPNPEYYRPKWKKEEMVCFQVYETVSEGTPVTPAFLTKKELIKYLIDYGTFWDDKGYTREQAEAFVDDGWVPSGMMDRGKMYFGIESADVLKSKE